MSDKISVIIPSDFTDVSAVAIKNALALKKSLPLNLTIFHVVNNLVLDNIKHNRTSMENITMKLGQTEDELRSIPDLSVITKVSEGSIFHRISKEAGEQKTDFVFLFIQKNSRIFNIAKRHTLLKLFIKRCFA